ncbi:hypothetical protein ACVOMV_21225 [Mesorhizobium atlanticum]
MVDGRIISQLTGRHQLTDKGHRIEAQGDGQFEAVPPGEDKVALCRQDELRRRRTATTAGGVDIERATIESDTVHGTATGNVDPKGASGPGSSSLPPRTSRSPSMWATARCPSWLAVQKATVRGLRRRQGAEG